MKFISESNGKNVIYKLNNKRNFSFTLSRETAAELTLLVFLLTILVLCVDPAFQKYAITFTLPAAIGTILYCGAALR